RRSHHIGASAGVVDSAEPAPLTFRHPGPRSGTAFVSEMCGWVRPELGSQVHVAMNSGSDVSSGCDCDEFSEIGDRLRRRASPVWSRVVGPDTRPAVDGLACGAGLSGGSGCVAWSVAAELVEPSGVSAGLWPGCVGSGG